MTFWEFICENWVAITGVIGSAAGSGVISSKLTAKQAKKKADIEIESLKNSNTAQIQDSYQELVIDLRKDIDDLKAEKEETRERLSKTEKDARIMKDALYLLLEDTCSIECEKRRRLPSKEVDAILEQLK